MDRSKWQCPINIVVSDIIPEGEIIVISPLPSEVLLATARSAKAYARAAVELGYAVKIHGFEERGGDK